MLTHRKPILVLIVEDSRVDASLLEATLVANDPDKNFSFLHAENFSTALSLLASRPVDVVILDLGLPDTEGPEAILSLNRSFPSLPIVIFSGRSDEVIILKALEYGAQEFLVKGECSGDVLRHAIFSALFRKSLRKKSPP